MKLAAELRGAAVTVNAYRPGGVDMAMEAWIRQQDPERIGTAVHGRLNQNFADGTLITHVSFGRRGRAWPGQGIISPGKERQTQGNGQNPDRSAGQPPSRFDRRLYFALMTVCIGLFVLSWAVLDRYSTTAAVVVSIVALAIPPFAVIIANAASAADRRRG